MSYRDYYVWQLEQQRKGGKEGWLKTTWARERTYLATKLSFCCGAAPLEIKATHWPIISRQICSACRKNFVPQAGIDPQLYTEETFREAQERCEKEARRYALGCDELRCGELDDYEAKSEAVTWSE